MDKDVSTLKGVGLAVKRKLESLGITTIHDALYFFPKRYEDYTKIIPIAAAKPGAVTFKVRIKSIQGRYVRRGLHITEAVASDESGSVKIVWFNQPYRASSLIKDEIYLVSGVYGLQRQRMTLTSPRIEKESAFPLHTARILPIYRETKGLKSAMIRKVIHEALQEKSLNETLPVHILSDHKLFTLSDALQEIHFPTSTASLEKARRRFGFEEVLYISLASLMNKQENEHNIARSIPFRLQLAKKFVSELPFKLTDDQRRVLWRIFQDMERAIPMNRLVEGDVGSGKTVIAALAAAMAIAQGFQVAYMAPTEILAKQHAVSLHEMLKPLGMHDKLAVLLGSLKPAEKKRVHAALQAHDAEMVVGTHALFSEKVRMRNLGLVIVDEQHRFGVEQRKKLQAKAGTMPHVLTMTATPIPRTLALTIFGELDISTITAMPSGRKRIITELVSPSSRSAMYAHVREELERGRQAFVVCPLIEPQEGLKTPSAVDMHNKLQKLYKGYSVGLLHGKMKPEDKERVMQQFVNGDVHILVATTVIEVGVNVPNASVMVLEGADRFGLAQMHQLRGRVGRSAHQGYCYVVPSDTTTPSPRLKAFKTTYDGFQLSELDLSLRGPGAIYGVQQHGALDLRIAQITDKKLVKSARSAAEEFLVSDPNLLNYPYISARVSKIRAVTNLN